jgi:hypothetical protein
MHVGPEFEAASLKLNPNCGGEGAPGRGSPGRLNPECVSVETLIDMAYGIFADGLKVAARLEVLGGPPQLTPDLYHLSRWRWASSSAHSSQGLSGSRLPFESFSSTARVTYLRKGIPNVLAAALALRKVGSGISSVVFTRPVSHIRGRSIRAWERWELQKQFLHLKACYSFFVATRNVRLALPEDLLRRMKLIAAKRDTSISALLAATLSDLADQEKSYAEARGAMRCSRTWLKVSLSGLTAWSTGAGVRCMSSDRLPGEFVDTNILSYAFDTTAEEKR